MATGKEMCQIISRWMKEAKGIDRTPEQIWNYSPTGELSLVFCWYDEAMIYFEWPNGPHAKALPAALEELNHGIRL